ncbi:MAG: TonB-dependent receptor plug domain-containing protein [Desulfobacteraceae bacterium]
MGKIWRTMKLIGLGLGLTMLWWGLIGPGMATATEEKATETAATEEKVEVIEEIAVTATRTPLATSDIPQSVTVITEEQIKASPFERVEDIIRQVPGVYNFRHYGLHTNGIVSPIRMRGVGNNRTLFLVDGVPQNDNFNNAIAWVAWGYIPKDAIERIEIVRGPMSALYGSEGLGGVVNIITKKPSDPRETSVAGKLGNGSTYGSDVFYGQKFQNLGLLLAGGIEKSHGFFMDEPKEDYTIKRYSEVGKVLGKVGYDFTPQSNLTFTGLYYHHDQSQGREYFNSTLGLDQYWLTYTHDWDLVNFKGLLFLNRAHKIANQDTAKDNYASPFWKEHFPDPMVWGVDLQGTVFPAQWLTVTSGITYKYAFWEYNVEYFTQIRDSGARGRQHFVSPFVNADLRFWDGKLLANVGGRFDWIESRDGRSYDTKPAGGLPPFDDSFAANVWRNFSPKGGIVFHPDAQTALKASAGTGFRTPSLFELYKTHIRGGGTFLRIPNPDLNPEKITSYEVSVERDFFNQLLAKATFYQGFAKDYIGDRLLRSYIGPGGKTYSEYRSENISRVDIKGVEVELEWYPRRDLSVFANYTWNSSKIDEDEEDPLLEGNYLPNDPIHKFHLGILYKNPSLANIFLLANYYEDIFYDFENTFKCKGYFTMDASIYRSFFDHLTLRVDLENIFNRKYPIFMRADSTTIVPGFLVMGKVIVNF